MSNFYVSISSHELAEQVADLLNANNRLTRLHNASSISSGAIDYFIELSSIDNSTTSKVVGCVGLIKEHTSLSRIKHLSVHPKFRRKGIARKLLLLAITNCDTEDTYMIIRDDNLPSLIIAEKLGFIFISKVHTRKGYNLITVGRRTK